MGELLAIIHTFFLTSFYGALNGLKNSKVLCINNFGKLLTLTIKKSSLRHESLEVSIQKVLKNSYFQLK